MSGAPDPDWYFEHVLYYAEPSGGGRVEVGEAARWDEWWRRQAAGLAEDDLLVPPLRAAAARQGFVLSSDQLAAAGLTRHCVRWRVEHGVWCSPARGVISPLGRESLVSDGDGGIADRWLVARRRHALQTSAGLLLNPGHVACGRSAATLHGLPVRELPDRPELSTPLGRSVRRAGARVADTARDGIGSWFGAALTDPAWTVCDLARHDRRDGVMAADAALRQRVVGRDALEAVVGRSVGWPGVRSAREIVAFAAPLAESALESLLRLALHDSGFPAPELQVEIAAPGRRRPYRVDMLWPRQRLILEADGRGKYTADELWREKARENELRRLGYRIERVIWADVVGSWPRTAELLWVALGA